MSAVVEPAVSGRERALYQELRLALVFNGGTSLAVWMGGVAKEIDRFRTALARTEPEASRSLNGACRALLDATRTMVITDVVSGASAGGINGALLAYVVGNGKSLECAGPNAIRDVWQQLGSMENLLYTDGHTPSILKTNEVLFTGCAQVFDDLSRSAPDLGSGISRWVRLAVAATDCYGYPTSVRAARGSVTGSDHRLLFRFRRVVYPTNEQLLLSEELREAARDAAGDRSAASGWPILPVASDRDLSGENAVPLLARAARTTSSFPFAFAPSELPLNYRTDEMASGEPGTATPAMADVLVSALKQEPFVPEGDHARRWAIDGGVWDNSPFSAVLRAIDQTPSTRDVRRVLMYVVGTRDEELRQAVETEPSLPKSLLAAVAIPADVSFANDITRIRNDLDRRDRQRANIVRLLGGEPGDGGATPDVFAIAAELFPLYKQPAAPERAVIPPSLGELAALPPVSAGLDAWGATADDWRWGSEPVRFAVQEARKLLRQLLRAMSSARTEWDDEMDVLLRTRKHLSQIAWLLDDVSGATAEESGDQARLVCGRAMHEFADAVSQVFEVVSTAPVQAPAQGNLSRVRAAVVIASGGPEQIIKRALALHVAVTSLAADTRDYVDYTFAAIRPATQWPSGSGPAADGRPPLAGAGLHHFSGFFRASYRLHDWMWGRIDGNWGIIDALLTKDLVMRLTDNGQNEEFREQLAADLAGVAIPLPTNDVPDADVELLAASALQRWGIEAEPADSQRGPASEWRSQLASAYDSALAAVVASDSFVELDTIKHDIAARFRYAIVAEERDDLLKACEGDDGPRLPDGQDPSARPDDFLRQLVPDALCPEPDAQELVRDGGNAVANILSAIGHDEAATAARGAVTVTSDAMGVREAIHRFLHHYIEAIRQKL